MNSLAQIVREAINWNMIATGLIGLAGTAFASWMGLKMARIAEESKQAREHAAEAKTTSDKILVEVNHAGTIKEEENKRLTAHVLRLEGENQMLKERHRGVEIQAVKTAAIAEAKV